MTKMKHLSLRKLLERSGDEAFIIDGDAMITINGDEGMKSFIEDVKESVVTDEDVCEMLSKAMDGEFVFEMIDEDVGGGKLASKAHPFIAVASVCLTYSLIIFLLNRIK